MRICMLTNMYPHPGRPSYGAFVKSQIDSIRDLGHDVEVIFINGRASRWNYLRAFRQLRKALEKTTFDVIHAHYGLSGMVALFQCRVPVVISFCGDDLLGSPDAQGNKTLLSRLIVTLGKMAAYYADGIIVKSRQMRGCLKERDRFRAHVIPNGVDFCLFKPQDCKAARLSLGLDLDKKFVLFPSTPYEKRKRVDLAEEAIAILRKECELAELLVVYHQPQEVLPVYMSACDVLLMTSDWEGSSNVVKEAMACDLPVVAVEAGDAWEVIEGVDHCYSVERDATRIAEGLTAVLRSESRSNGRALSARLDLSTIARSVEQVYTLSLEKRQCAG